MNSKIVVAVALSIVGISSHAAVPPNFIAQQVVTARNINGAEPAPIERFDTRHSGIIPTYSSQLNYLTGAIFDHAGNPIPEGHAKTSIDVDLPHGEFKLYSESLLPGTASGIPVGELSAGVSLSYMDQLTVLAPHATAATPAFITLTLRGDGTFSPLLSPTVGGGGVGLTFNAVNSTEDLFIQASGSTNTSCNGAGGLDNCTGSEDSFNAAGSYATAIAGLKYGTFDQITLKMPLYHEVSNIELTLGVDVGSSQGVADFSHTAKLSFDAPGMTVTSESGYLLAAPIPEPEIYAMLFAGLGVIGVMARRKQRIN